MWNNFTKKTRIFVQSRFFLSNSSGASIKNCISNRDKKNYAKFVNPIVVSCLCYTITIQKNRKEAHTHNKKTRNSPHHFVGTKWKNEHGTHVLTVIRILIADFVLWLFFSVFFRSTVCVSVCALDFTLMNRIEPNKKCLLCEPLY